MKQKVIAVVLTVLLVTASMPASIGTAAAATTYEKKFTSGPEVIVADISNVSGGMITLKVHTEDAPGCNTTIFMEDYNATSANDYPMFRNSGAYSNITMEVVPDGAATGNATFLTGSGMPSIAPRRFIGTTGGDSDLTCDFTEKLQKMTIPGWHNVDCAPLPGSMNIDTSGDAAQTEQEIYTSGQEAKAYSDTYFATLDNSLQDTQTQALIIGKNKYIQELNNGSSKSVALTESQIAIEDYYSAKQVNLVNMGTISVEKSYDMTNKAQTATGVNNTFVHMKDHEATSAQAMTGTASNTVTLENGSTVTFSEPRWSHSWSSGYSATYGWNPETGAYQVSGDQNAPDATAIRVNEYDAGVGMYHVVDFASYETRWTDISSQSASAKSQMETVVNNTYSSYVNGDINNSDLVDPYVLASEFSPGSEYESWAAAQLTLLGTNSPETFDKIGKFDLDVNGTSRTGVLMSQENPASGQFETNVTYDPSAIGGTQYVIEADLVTELTENFTIHNITTKDGQNRQNVTIVEKTYTTSNVTELKALYDELQYWRTQAQARAETRNGGGGGAFFEGSSALIAGVVIVAGVALLVGGEKNGGRRY